MQAISAAQQAILKSKFQSDADGFSGRIEIDILVPEVPPASQPTIVQQKIATDTQPGTVTLSSPVTVGNLIVAVQVMRPSTGGLTGSMGGTGWTTLAEAYLQQYGGGASIRQVLIQGKVAPDSTQTFNHAVAGGNSTGHIAVYELSGASLSDISILELDNQTGGGDPTVVDLGNFPAASGVALIGVAAWRGTDQKAIGFACTPGTGWTEDYDDNIAGGFEPWAYHAHATPSGADLDPSVTFDATAVGQFMGNHGGAAVLFVPTGGVPAQLVTTGFRCKRIALSKESRMDADAFEVELHNEDLSRSLYLNDQVFQPNNVCRIYQWYGDKITNETQTFEGLIDEPQEDEPPRTAIVRGKDMMKRLIVQTIHVESPQGAEEAGAVRTTANYVYLGMEIDAIVSDLLDKAGWPAAKRIIVPTNYALAEYLGPDGDPYLSAINDLASIAGYRAWADEQGNFRFEPLGQSVDPDTDTPATPVWTFRGHEDVHLFRARRDDYELRTRIRVVGPLSTNDPTWRQVWKTNVIKKPVGIWYVASESTHIRILDRSTKKIYRVKQSDRTKDGTGIWPLYVGGNVDYPLGLSGDPADSGVFWVLDAAWRVTGGASLVASVHKYNATTGAWIAEYALPNGRWADLKVTSSALWLMNRDDDKVHKRSKTDASSIASYTTVHNGVNQTDPTGIAVDGTTLCLFFQPWARFLLVDESDPTTIDTTNALSVTKGVIKTVGTRVFGGEIDTTTHGHLYAVSDDLGLTWKFDIVTPTDTTVWEEVADQALEDDLGFRAQSSDREHDLHPADPDHPFEIRRETIDLEMISDRSQAIETATRWLARKGRYREVVEIGTVGNPGLQKGDLVRTESIAALGSARDWVLDAYRTEMGGEAGTYFGIAVLLPADQVY